MVQVMDLPGFQLAGMKTKEYKVDCGDGPRGQLRDTPGKAKMQKRNL
jgi:hypothetical protein